MRLEWGLNQLEMRCFLLYDGSDAPERKKPGIAAVNYLWGALSVEKVVFFSSGVIGVFYRPNPR